MKPKLPREMLWTDKETMDEFFELEPINEELFRLYTRLREELYVVKSDPVYLFNEVYYQTTRMVFEQPLPQLLPVYIYDAKANLGWKYSAEFVMIMAHWLIRLTENHEKVVNKYFTYEIAKTFGGYLYWWAFRNLSMKLNREKKSVQYAFQPCPNDVESLKGKFFNWREITHNYNWDCIEAVINLWHDKADKQEIAQMIMESLNNDKGQKINNVEYEKLKIFIEQYLCEDSSVLMCAEGFSQYYTTQSLEEKLEKTESEKTALKSRISELEAENERLKALLEKKKSNGTARKFTLVQIADYCKGCVEWNDAKEIVRMLNKLLRHIGTEEDSELVDSIEEEFKNRCMVSVNSPGNLIGNSFNYGKREE